MLPLAPHPYSSLCPAVVSLKDNPKLSWLRYKVSRITFTMLQPKWTKERCITKRLFMQFLQVMIVIMTPRQHEIKCATAILQSTHNLFYLFLVHMLQKSFSSTAVLSDMITLIWRETRWDYVSRMLCNTSLTITGAQCKTWTIFLQELNLQSSHQYQVSSPTSGNIS